jgi:tRNA U34 5-carboxymethylaminomethyl modifying GTPase MnmE/TrmE
MKATSSYESRFISDVEQIEFIASDVENIVHSLEGWLAQLSTDLHLNRLIGAGLSQRSALVYEASAIDRIFEQSAQRWALQWARLKPAQALSDSFHNNVVLLVFGKFNAGKSSFCNFLADRFADYGKSTEYFRIEAGNIVSTSKPFHEGATETTASLQGVRLSGKLILLDTPGLHSVTPENAALTQRFTESADAVLWLTSSTAPGQVQELNELSRELHRNKPLLPIVTRSDVFEEDEVGGEIRKVLCNKSERNRGEQEHDVKIRAEEKLAALHVPGALLKAPISVSAHMARQSGESASALQEAGFERLYAALGEIIEPALAYKRRKAAETFLHHIEENVLATLCCEILPLISELDAAAKSAIAQLETKIEKLNKAVWRSIAPILPRLLDMYSSNRDIESICADLSKSLFAAYVSGANDILSDYEVTPSASLTRIRLITEKGFYLIENEVETDLDKRQGHAEIDYQRLYAALSSAVHERLLKQSRVLNDECQAFVRQLIEATIRLEMCLKSHEQRFFRLKQDFRSRK